MNKATLHQVRLVRTRVTIRGYTALVFNQATQVNSAWSSLHG